MSKLMLKNNWYFWMMFSVVTGCFFIIVALAGCRIINWNWITSFAIGQIAFLLTVPMTTLSVKKMLASENIYYYYFLYLIKIGVIVVPFLFAIYLPNTFSVFGLLIGLVVIVVSPFARYCADMWQQKGKKGGE